MKVCKLGVNMKNIQLSKRLQAIAACINNGAVIADIGSDHAYLPCYLCMRDKNIRAIAGEVARGPYQSARGTVEKFELEDRIDVRLGSGLEIIHEEDHVTDIVIAGMGGSLISDILLMGKEKLTNVQRLILQPNNNEVRVRETLEDLQFILTEEVILQEKGLFYEILLAEPIQQTKQPSPYVSKIKEKQLFFGPFLMEESSKAFVSKWKQEYKQLIYTINQMKKSEDPRVEEKLKQFNKRLDWIKEVIS